MRDKLPLGVPGVAALFVLVVSATACGGGNTEPAISPEQARLDAITRGTPDPATRRASAEPAPEPEPAPKPQPSAEPAAPEPEGSGRIAVLKSDPESITDIFGANPARLELGAPEKATLRIPADALSQAYNITFELAPKGKSQGAPIGKIYRLRAQVAGSVEYSRALSSSQPFQLEFPAGSAAGANLAIGEISVGANGKETVTWRVLEHKRVEGNVAYFETPDISDWYVHLTTQAPRAL